MKKENPNHLYKLQPITAVIPQDRTPKTVDLFTWKSILQIHPHTAWSVLYNTVIHIYHRS